MKTVKSNPAVGKRRRSQNGKYTFGAGAAKDYGLTVESGNCSSAEERYLKLKQDLAEAREALRNAAFESHPSANDGLARSKQVVYEELIARIRQIVRETLPAHAIVLVVNKGDSDLLKLGGRITWHFPRNEDGAYAGHHPADSGAAIEHLEQLREAGADYLVLPRTAFWWLEFYQDFRRHLETHYSIVVNDREACLIFALRQRLEEPQPDILTDMRVMNAEGQVSGNGESKVLPLSSASESGLRVQLVEALLMLGRYSRARDVLLEGRALEPENLRLLIKLAETEFRKGNKEAGNRYAAEIIERAPLDYDVNLELARIAWQAGQLRMVESQLVKLSALYPPNAESMTQLANLYCACFESQDLTADKELRSRLIGHVPEAETMRAVQSDVKLRLAEALANLGQNETALSYLRAGLVGLDFRDPALQQFVVRLLHPAISNASLIPFDEPRALAALLVHLGNGFASVHNEFKRETCYQLAAECDAQPSAANLNLGFKSLASSNPFSALRYFSKIRRVYTQEAAQVCWPSQNGQLWPAACFNLAHAFESLKDPAVPWPKITVITPSYNQADYIEETLLSVLNQHYPALEYIVVDGGSTDGSVEVLRSYEKRLERLIIEPDQGQTDAINKGLRLATGELILWINSDDMLGPGALFMIALAYLDERSDVIAGFCMEHSARRFNLINLPAVTQATFNATTLGEIFEYWLKGHYFYQPEVAFSRRILDQVGGELDQSLFYTMDYDFWVRCANAGGKVSVIHWPVGLFRRHDAQKTSNLDSTIIEQGLVRDRYAVPMPAFERKLNIQKRFQRALAKTEPRVAVVSTRASKIFSKDTDRELADVFSREGLCVRFYEDFETAIDCGADLLIALVHVFKEHEALCKLREAKCEIPVVGWFWDNHHHVFDNYRTAGGLDICIAGHAFAENYLKSRRYLTASPVPLCVTQWTKSEAEQFFARFARCDRSDDLFGGFVRYGIANKRNELVQRLIDEGMTGIYFLEESDLERYFGKSPEQRFENWSSHKASLCLPLAGDVSQRLFDALLTGQIPIVPDDLPDLDAIIPVEMQEKLPIIRIKQYAPPEVRAAHQIANSLFDQAGAAGILRRHEFVMNNHMFSNRIGSILSHLNDFVKP
ncbi:MAG TPA: glycosyltransferase [Pyrinomonadaceae bacterium]